jgi:acetyl esterase/lipase
MEGLLPRAPGVELREVDVDGRPATWFEPSPSPSSRRVILYLHGGGYVIGSRKSHSPFASHLAASTGARVLLLDYRLAPEHPAPAAIDDAVRAYRWLSTQGVEPADIVIGGDSAGGGLTLSTLVALRDTDDALPAAGLLLSPWLDLTLSGDSMTTRPDDEIILSREILEYWGGLYRGSLAADDPVVSPLFAELSGLPPLLVQLGTNELLLDDANRVAAKVGDDSALTLSVWPDMFHVWPVLGAGLVPEAQDALDEIAAYLEGL